MIDRLGSSIFVAGAAASGAAVSSHPHDSVWVWLAPILCGTLAALIVRGIAITTPSRRKTTWIFEVLVTALSVLLTGVIVADSQLGIMQATMTGVGIGGLGVGVITFGKSAALSVLEAITKGMGGGTRP